MKIKIMKIIKIVKITHYINDYAENYDYRAFV